MCCVPWCDKEAVDAHHIIERALWDAEREDSGYVEGNGAPLCYLHHMDAEKSYITPNQLRRWCGISPAILPKELVPSHLGVNYDKWGMPYKPMPDRARIKYPHTPFFRCSPGGHVEEKRENTVIPYEALCNKDVVFTLKMDGSNATFDCNGVAARNATDASHASFDMLKSLHALFKSMIPEHLQFFGEWLYAKHSIHYTGDLALEDRLQLFAAIDHTSGEWLGWKSIQDWAGVLDIGTVPTLNECLPTRFTSPKDLENVVKITGKTIVEQGHEGIVVRSMYSYPWNELSQNIGKYVRKDHVQTSTHWANQRIIRNEVRQV
jgi:hypothetical protein